jgi:glycosyltransferase involved in cell wall biosynthesis
MKKEIFILCSDPPEQLGGVEACVREQVRGFQERGYAVRVWHRENSVSPFYHRNERKMSHHITDTLAGYFIGRAAQKAMHPEVAAVFSHSTVGWYPLRLPPGCKQFHLYHGTYRGQAEAIRPFISLAGYVKLKWWDSMVLERYSGRGKQVFCVSELIRLEVKRLFGYDGITLGNPLDLTAFRPLDRRVCRESLGLPAEGPIAVFVGNTQPTKNFPVVLRLIEALPEIQWVLALRGGTEGLNGLAGNARMMPNVPRTLIPQLYSAADFSVCPSRYDAFPYSIPEALACGLPVLSSLNGGSQQFLQEPPFDRLVIKDPDNIGAFISAAKELVARPDFYRQAVLDQVKPAVEAWMKPENYWKRFGQLTELWSSDARTAGA